MPQNTHSDDTLPNDSHPLLWSVVALLLFALIAVVGYQYREQQAATHPSQAAMDTNCMLHEHPCSARLSETIFAHLEVNPTPIIATNPIQLKLRLEGLQPQHVELQLQSESMDMGLNRYTFNDQGNRRYGAELILPVCISNRMTWRADINVQTADGLVQFPFRFESQRP